MATLSTNNPTLIDVAKTLDPDGKVATIVEILNETNEILDDISFIEGNLVTGNKTTIRSGLPEPTWRKLYGGVQPTKSTKIQITDDCGMLEDYAEVDKALADLDGNTEQFRLTEDSAHLEGMAQAMTDTIFYGNTDINPERFMGLAPRYNDLSANNAENIIDGGGTGSDNTSIWLVVWGPMTCFMMYPKGSKAGWNSTDKGQVTIEDADGSGGRMEAYRTHYKWDAGLCLKDWRYVVRIPNIDKSLLTKDASAGADIIDLMTQALELVPNLNMGRPVFYASRTIRSMLRRQTVAAVKNSTLSMEEVAGRKVVAFDGVPVRRCDALAPDEARVT